jgi:hypothetical protein
MNEVWKDIPNFEKYYQASDYGRIRSLPRTVTQMGHKSNYTRILNGKVLHPRLQNANYYVVWLSKEGEIYPQLVHRLIAKAFISNTKNEPCVNHKNGNKIDNQIGNLEWCSYSENIEHSHNIAGRKKTTKPIICVDLNREFKSQTDAAQELNISRCSISHALNKKSKTAGGFIWKFM